MQQGIIRVDQGTALRDPKHAVERTMPRPWAFPLQDRHLLAESDVFQLQRCAAQDDLADEGDEDHDDRLHAANGSRQWAEMPGFPRPTRF